MSEIKRRERQPDSGVQPNTPRAGAGHERIAGEGVDITRPVRQSNPVDCDSDTRSSDPRVKLAEQVGRFYDIVAKLRGEGGCPWDRAQTHETLERYLLEEAWEVIDTIRTGEMHKLCEELGDLLLQIGLHARIAQENGYFDLSDVACAINDKMIRRHPHVFEGRKRITLQTPDEVVFNWELIKKEEARRASVSNRGFCEQKAGSDCTARAESLASEMRRVPANWPATLQAERVQRIASRVGFDWERTSEVLDKVKEELGEIEELLLEYEASDAQEPGNGNGDKGNIEKKDRMQREEVRRKRFEEEIGDLLFSVVNLARFEDIDPEEALRFAVRRFTERFSHMEEMAEDRHLRLSDISLEKMDKLWELVKKDENRP